MGLLDFLGPALTTATQAAGAAQEGQLQGSRLLQAIRMQQAQLTKLGAETDKDRADTDRTRHLNLAPVLGEAGYAPAMGQVAGSEAMAKVPAAVEQQKQLEPGEVDLAGRKSAIEEGREGRLLTKRIEAEKFAPNQANAVAQPFVRQNQKLMDTVSAYSQAKNAFAEARAGNPAALKTAIIAYAGVADPKAQLRQGIINMVGQVDPSIKGNFDLALDRLTSGRLPPRIIDSMEQMVDRLHATNRAMYDQRRSGFLKSVPQAEPYVPRTEDVFDVPGMGGGTPGTDPVSAKIDALIQQGVTDPAAIKAALAGGH